MLERISSRTWHHPRMVLAGAVLFAALAGFFGHDVEHHLLAAGFTDPSSESEQAGDVLSDALGFSAQPGLVVLLRSPDGGGIDTTDPAITAEVGRLAEQLRGSAYVGNVINPLAQSAPNLIAADGHSLVLGAQLSTNDFEDKGGLADESVRERVTSDAVLVMARVKELRDAGMSNEDAVAHGVARTGRIISAAAVTIAVVFAAFAVSPVFFMKQIAVGMALGVIIDATVVRALLVPSLMRLLGGANWWAPALLRRFHDRFGIREG
jgi:uncharacterized membrane protein YdfJ with MMPL/SSD domain